MECKNVSVAVCASRHEGNVTDGHKRRNESMKIKEMVE